MMDTSEVASAATEDASQPAALNVGITLREARERMGMSVEDVAERIKFAPKQVEALESNDFAHLPQSTFLRGFVRSYARVLQLDEATLLAALPGASQSVPAVQAVQAAGEARGMRVPFPTSQIRQRVNVVWLGGALAVALLLVLFANWHESAPKSKPSEAVVEAVQLPLEPAASAVNDQQAPAPVAIAEPAKVTEPKKVAEPIRPKQVAAAVPSVATAPVAGPAVAAKPAVPLEMLKRRPLHFVFSEDTWAEVIDVNGAVLLSKTNRGGSEQWIGGPRRAPYDITIANPASVKLYYKGREIDLAPYAAAGTAHLKVE